MQREQLGREIHKQISKQADRLRALDEAGGYKAPDAAGLIERVKEHDPQLAAELDAAVDAIKSYYGFAGYQTGWAAHADANEED